MARGVEQVDHAVAVRKLHHRLVTEMPRCFSISIQSEVAWRAALRARISPATWIAPPNHSSFFGQRGLARVGVGDDREGAAQSTRL